MKEDSKNINESNDTNIKSEKNKSMEVNVKNKTEIKYTKIKLTTLSKHKPNSFTKVEKGSLYDKLLNRIIY